MKNPRRIIIEPLVTERGFQQRLNENKYFFEVARDANKIDIKHAIEHLFDVKVVKIATLNVLGKKRRVRTREAGKRPDWKKAIVTLAEGQKIGLFETTA